MSEFRKRPKDDFIQETDWQELYVLTNYWKSDLLFYRDDLRFLHRLIDKYILWITQSENLEKVQQKGREILQDLQQVDRLLEQVGQHLSHISGFIENPFRNNAMAFRQRHQDLEDHIAILIKEVRQNRKSLFLLTEEVMDSEQIAPFTGH